MLTPMTIMPMMMMTVTCSKSRLHRLIGQMSPEGVIWASESDLGPQKWGEGGRGPTPASATALMSKW